MKKSINLKKGVSLIVLVITIVLILIISSVVIMSFNDSNTLENANISKFVSNREAYQESLRLYINDAQTKTFSNYSVVELLTGNNGNDTYKIISSNSTYQLNINGIIVNAYKIDEGLFKQKLNIEIKKCRNCGKFFVPDNRSDEIYCSNIYENGKTCKEIGHFKVQQKLIQENDDLRIYRNVYQKLLLRTRRNPTNTKYAREFEFFKDDNNKWRENISKGISTEKEYIEWLKKQ